MNQDQNEIASEDHSKAQAVDRIQQPIVRPSFFEHALPAGMILVAIVQIVQHPKGETVLEIALEAILKSAVAFALLCMAVGHIYLTISRHIGRSNAPAEARRSRSLQPDVGTGGTGA